MNGEQELRRLEREETIQNIQGGIFPRERRTKLLRARQIEKSSSIGSGERADPVLEAAFQRSVGRREGNRRLTFINELGKQRQKESERKVLKERGQNQQHLYNNAQSKVFQSSQEVGRDGLEDSLGLKKISTLNSSGQRSENIAGKENFLPKTKLGANLQKFEILISDKNFKKRNQLGDGTIYLMFITAIIFDLIQVGLSFIPVVGWILSSFVSIMAWFTFYIWTSIKGWGFSDTAKSWLIKRLRQAKKVAPIIELIPIINALPTWTFNVILQMVILKADDKIYNTTHGKLDMKDLVKSFHQYENRMGHTA